jgi:hypothetical protein
LWFSRNFSKTLIFQLAVIITAFLLARGVRAATQSWGYRLAQRIPGLWGAFNEERIAIPMPQREVHIRGVSPSAISPAREAQAAHD